MNHKNRATLTRVCQDHVGAEEDARGVALQRPPRWRAREEAAQQAGHTAGPQALHAQPRLQTAQKRLRGGRGEGRQERGGGMDAVTWEKV